MGPRPVRFAVTHPSRRSQSAIGVGGARPKLARAITALCVVLLAAGTMLLHPQASQAQTPDAVDDLIAIFGGRLTEEGPVIVQKFGAQAGWLYVIDIQLVSLKSGYVKVYDPNVNLVARGRGHLAWVAEADGEYRIAVSGSREGGSYVFTLRGRADDHGANPDQATTVEFGKPIQGELWEVQETDYFLVEEQAGRLYVAEVQSEGLLNARVLSLSLSLSSPGFPSAKRRAWVPEVTGTRILRVVPGLNQSGAYTLTVTVQLDDHGANPDQATTVEFGKPIQGELWEVPERDYFLVEEQAGRLYVAEVQSEELLNAIFTSLSSPGFPSAKRRAWVPEVTGTRILRVVAGLNQSGKYTLTVTVQTDDHGDGPSNATVVELGRPINGELWEVPETDWFLVEARAGWHYVVDLQSGTLEDERVRVEDPNGSFVAGSGGTGHLVWEAKVDGGYTIQVTDRQGGSGSYTLTVTGEPPPPTPVPSATPVPTVTLVRSPTPKPTQKPAATATSIATSAPIATQPPQPTVAPQGGANGGGCSAPLGPGGTTEPGLFAVLLAVIGLVATRRRFSSKV